jgi:hypothetical protein
MERFTAVIILAACVASQGCQFGAQASREPGNRAVETLRSQAAAQPLATIAPAALTIQGRPISDRLSPIVERTTDSFQHALVCRPSDNTTTKEQRQYAALVVQELPGRSNSLPESLRIGAVVTDASGREVVDTERPTVYAAESHLILKDIYCPQRVYVWAYPAADSRCAVWRGVRETYGPNGYPLIWEVLSSKGQPSVLFLCSTLEEAAEKEYGRALPGRKSCAERALDEQPDVVVARILPPGAEPAGPMVYLDAASNTITTLLCRCMPAQAKHLADGPSYDVLPLDILGDVQIAADGPFRLAKSLTPPASDGGPPWLERALRLPTKF